MERLPGKIAVTSQAWCPGHARRPLQMVRAYAVSSCAANHQECVAAPCNSPFCNESRRPCEFERPVHLSSLGHDDAKATNNLESQWKSHNLKMAKEVLQISSTLLPAFELLGQGLTLQTSVRIGRTCPTSVAPPPAVLRFR